MANNNRLAELNVSIEAKKLEIASGEYVEYSVLWAKRKKELATLVEEFELLSEAKRVETAVRGWEELHPPSVEECPICLEEASYEVSVCEHCWKGMCNRCWHDMQVTGDGRKCPTCRADHSSSDDEVMNALNEGVARGIATAQCIRGVNLIESGTARSHKEEGLRLVRLAADQNHPASLYELGEYYYTGVDDILEQDYSKSFTVYEQAAKLGVPNAHVKLGQIYSRGEGVEKDHARGLYIIRFRMA